MINLDIRIMATPRRKEMAENLCKKLDLSLDHIVWDDRPNGGFPRYTARKAWLFPFEETCTHRIVIQDDVDICDNFLEGVQKCLEFQPTESWTFCTTLKDTRESYYRRILSGNLTGQCIVMDKKKILECWDWIDSNLPETLDDDDASIGLYHFETEKTFLTTIPSLCNNSPLSSIGNEYPPMSPSFCKDAFFKKDWTNKKIFFLVN